MTDGTETFPFDIDADALDDMRRETQKAHKLSHPHIVRIHDALAWLGYVSGDTVSPLTQHEILENDPPAEERERKDMSLIVDEDAAFRKRAITAAAIAGAIMILLIFMLKRGGDSTPPMPSNVAGKESKEMEEILPRAGLLDESFDPGEGPDGNIYRMIHDANGAIVICGTFEQFDGTPRPRMARLTADGALDTAFDPGKGPQGPDRNVRALLPMPDGGVLVGGSFDKFNDAHGQFRFVRLKPDGKVDPGFKIGPQVRHPARTFEWAPDGNILAAGNWTSFSVPHRGLAMIDVSGRYVSGFNPGPGLLKNEGIFELAFQSDGKILLSGRFKKFSGHSRPHLIRLNPDGSLDAAFISTGGPDPHVGPFAAQPDGKILIGGLFERVGETPRGRIARLNADGSLDERFAAGAGFNAKVNDLALLSNGKIVVVGGFESFNGVARNRIARLNADGSLDGSFDPGEGADADVTRVVVEPDGKLLIAGAFTRYDGRDRVRVARLHGGGIENTIRPKMGRGYEVPGLGLKLAYVQPGSFNMGSNPSDNDGLKDRQPIEGPMTKTTFVRGFWLGKHEVTQGEYESLMRANPSQHKDDATRGRLPVDRVSWNDTAEFCRRLTALERSAGRLPEGFEYALPTEAQWEFACRAGSRAEFSFGDRLSVGQANVAEGYAVAGEKEYILGKPAPVGSYPANAWGLHDMHGNVWEWTHDWFAAYPGGEAADPSGPFEGKVRTCRGGCWKYHAKFARSARRGYLDPSTKHSDLGFRVALRPTGPVGAADDRRTAR